MSVTQGLIKAITDFECSCTFLIAFEEHVFMCLYRSFRTPKRKKNLVCYMSITLSSTLTLPCCGFVPTFVAYSFSFDYIYIRIHATTSKYNKCHFARINPVCSISIKLYCLTISKAFIPMKTTQLRNTVISLMRPLCA